MQVAILALSALIGLIGVQQGDAWNLRDKSHAAEFDTINDMLVKLVPNDDPKANMALIKETYETKVRGKRDSMVKALEKLVALETIASADKCNNDGYELLNALNLGTRSQALTVKPSRRIDWIVRHYAIEHSNFCYELYPKLVDAKMAEVDPKHAEYVKLLEDEDMLTLELGIWVTDRGYNKKEKCGNIDSKWENTKVKSLNPYKAIIRSSGAAAASGDEEGKSDSLYLAEIGKLAPYLRVVDARKVEKMVDRYIYNPCVDVNQKVVEEYLESIRFGLTMQRMTGSTEHCFDTVHDRVILGYCSELMRDQKYRQILIERMIKIIERRP